MKDQIKDSHKINRKIRCYGFCYNCGSRAKYYGHNPYNAEINNDLTKNWICQTCLTIFNDDI